MALKRALFWSVFLKTLCEALFCPPNFQLGTLGWGSSARSAVLPVKSRGADHEHAATSTRRQWLHTPSSAAHLQVEVEGWSTTPMAALALHIEPFSKHRVFHLKSGKVAPLCWAQSLPFFSQSLMRS
jgi:hypothetical protein